MFLCVSEKELHLSYGGAVCDPLSQIIEAHSGRAGFVKPEDLRDGVRYRFTYKGREYSGTGTNVVSTPSQKVAVIKIDQEIPGTAASGSLVDPEYLDTIWTE